MDFVLRPFDLGTTQWYVLHVLADEGPTNQREFARQLEIERATLSAVISALVRKGLIEQTSDAGDQRQKVLRITPDGRELWTTLPDPIALIAETAFSGVDPAELEITKRVLTDATRRLIDFKKEQKS